MRIRIEAHPEGRAWRLSAPAFDEAPTTTARSFVEIPSAARQLAVTAADIAPSTVELDLVVTAGGVDVLQAESRVAAERAAAEAAAAQLAVSAREVAGQLRTAGLTLADIADVLGVSYQRVSQLLAD
ncbi:hypothetical protein [Mycobacterium sp. OTB74]|uniref:hypothetical protein n=1 Tax=Mycobacterium sp. OTB74 TaxID=1853452 RepID=UPI0024735637|nr:hypothetical protein [Mycobacterium sp. OTB74]MDH6245476.1 DNA-directed RNA polymerase specialized sigma24 family protein [Mycobacterium sp. OTB74]